jgi:predicted transposase/invertase (TIGR01784 family)
VAGRSPTRLTEDLEIHILELPKFVSAEERGEQISPALGRWVRFLSSKEEVEFEQLAKEDPVMHEAKEALERISSQSEWCQIAEVRRRALDTYEIEMSAAREEGISQGIVQGNAKSLLRVLERRFGHVPVWIREQIVSVKPENGEQLEKWLDQAVDASSLEDVFIIG